MESVATTFVAHTCARQRRAAGRPRASDRSNDIRGAHVRLVAVDVRYELLPLEIPGTCYTMTDLYQVLLAAAVQRRSLESSGASLVAGACANTVC